jgi:Tfp pilus assembly protein PilF
MAKQIHSSFTAHAAKSHLTTSQGGGSKFSIMASCDFKQFLSVLLLTMLAVGSSCSLGLAQQPAGEAATHQQLGMSFLASKQFDRAITEFREALRLAPDDPETHNGLGLAWIGKGDLNGACEEF